MQFCILIKETNKGPVEILVPLEQAKQLVRDDSRFIYKENAIEETTKEEEPVKEENKNFKRRRK